MRIFIKNNIQEAFSPKTSISGEIVSEILLQLCYDDSIQILLNLTQFITLRNKSNNYKDFRLGNFINLKAHFSMVLTDFPNLPMSNAEKEP